MRRILPVLMVFAGGLSVGAGTASADATCAGNACGVVTLSADGCQWTNKGDKAVRLSLSGGGVARMVTVLGPGEGYKESDKKHCAAGEGDGRYDASFAKLASVPTEVAAKIPTPRAKPAAPIVAVAPAATTVAPVPAPAVAVVSAEAGVAPPRAKPAPSYPPLPRVKPQVPSIAAAAPVAAVAPTAAIEPASAAPTVAACTQDCPPILFKVIDNCLWVLNPNPRAVAFEAEVGGKRMTLVLEAADGAEADARAAALAAGTVIKDDGTLHMRLRDPFQSAGSGIPIYRARLGAAGACVKSRDQVSRFSANYVK